MNNGNVPSCARKNMILELMKMANTSTCYTYKDGQFVPEYNSDIKVITVDINPELASEILVHNIDSNRNIRPGRIKDYVADLKSTHWKSNGEPIVCADTGILVDGQHRLTSIIKSGVTMKNVPIMFVPIENATNYDTGANRSTVDISRLNGLTEKIYLNKRVIAAFRTSIAFALHTEDGITNDIKLEEVEKHKDAAYFILDNIVSKSDKIVHGVNRAGVTSAILNAYIRGVNPTILKDFITVLIYHGGPYNASEKMQTYLVSVKCKLLMLRGGGQVPTKEAYYRTQEALYRYINNTPIKSCRSEYKEVEYFSYPID